MSYINAFLLRFKPAAIAGDINVRRLSIDALVVKEKMVIHLLTMKSIRSMPDIQG